MEARATQEPLLLHRLPRQRRIALMLNISKLAIRSKLALIGRLLSIQRRLTVVVSIQLSNLEMCILSLILASPTCPARSRPSAALSILHCKIALDRSTMRVSILMQVLLLMARLPLAVH